MARDTAKWLEQAVIYEVFPRNHSSEGNLSGVTKDLERIKDLGTDIVWLMPIHPIGKLGRKGDYGSPYSIKDYRQIDSDLGTESDFKELIDTAHELGLKVMMDVVYNHTSNDSKLSKEHPEWFYRDNEGSVSRKFEEWSDIADLNYDEKELWEYQIDTLAYWANMGVDGFRCDVAPMVPIDFWIQARKQLSDKNEIIWLAESVEKSFVKFLRDSGYRVNCDPILHQAFDLTFDYDGVEYLKKYFQGTGELKDYLNHLHIQETLYPEHAVKMRFLENHDNPRIASIISDKARLRNWTLFYNLLPGAVLLYSGQEYALTHWPDLFSYDTIDWQNGDDNFYEFIRKALHVARDIKKKCSNYTIEQIANGIIKMEWWNGEETFVAIINLEDRYRHTPVGLDYLGVDMLSGKRIKLDSSFVLGKDPILIKVDTPGDVI
ncbi:MAG: alpha-amylase family glycosyl hydrolase [Halanaerobiales bacterium]